VASLIGTSTAGAYIESATGIEAGGRSGFASVITAFLFLLTLFFAPFMTAIPQCAYGPSLIIVGLLMLSPITNLTFSDLTETIPAFTVIVLMSFTYNLGIGITGGFVVYPLMKAFSGRIRDVHPGMWVLAIMSALFFIFYPY
jgi:AGZA family xanthine/uracil permease-like MFS transporter